MSSLPSPSVSVEFQELKESTSISKLQNAQPFEQLLTTHSDRDRHGQLLRRGSYNQTSQFPVLDLTKTDYLCFDNSMKKIFSLPCSKQEEVFSVHRMSNTLLVEHIPNLLDMQYPFSQTSDEATNKSASPTISTHSTLRAAATASTERSDYLSKPLRANSVHLPPLTSCVPGLPDVPKQSGHLASWNFHDMRIAFDCDVPVHATDDHPAYTLHSIDINSETPVTDAAHCLDLYLDNLIANVPELALALHSKGFVRGVEFLPTHDIPFLDTVSLAETVVNPAKWRRRQNLQKRLQIEEVTSICNDLFQTSVQDTWRKDPSLQTNAIVRSNSFSSIDLKIADGGNTVSSPIPSQPLIYNDSQGRACFHHQTTSSGAYSSSSTNSSRSQYQKSKPIFDPAAIDLDATTIMRFLKDNCREENGMYILRKCENSHRIELYDVSQAAQTKQKQFMWMLSMLSYRFARRLNQHAGTATPSGQIRMRAREMALLRSCADLLEEISRLGGEDHASVRAAVLEQMADIHLSRVEEFGRISTTRSHSLGLRSSSRRRSHSQDQLGATASRSTDTSTSEPFSVPSNHNLRDEDYDEMIELREAGDLLSQSVSCLDSLVQSVLKIYSQSAGDADDSSDTDDTDNVIAESLAAQLAGVLHKLVQVCSLQVMYYINSAQCMEVVRALEKLVPSLSLWSFTRSSFRSNSNTAAAPSDPNSLFLAADKTILENLPLLWDLLGEATREVSRNAAILFVRHDNIRSILINLVFVWNKLTESVLIDEERGGNNGVGAGLANDLRGHTVASKRAKRKKQKRRSGKLDSMTSNCDERFSRWWQMIALHISPLASAHTSPEPSSCFPTSLKSLAEIILKEDSMNAVTSLPNILKYLCMAVSPLVLNEEISLLYPLQSEKKISIPLSDETQILVISIQSFLSASLLYSMEDSVKIGNNLNNFHRLGQATDEIKPSLKPRINLVDNIFVHESMRRLAECCNALGQSLPLSITNIGTVQSCAINDHALGAQDDAAYLSQYFFVSAAILFDVVGDSTNSIIVRCNLSLSLRTQAIRLIRQIPSELSSTEKKVLQESLLEQIHSGIQHCQFARRLIESKLLPATATLLQAVLSEIGQAYLSIGINLRSLILFNPTENDNLGSNMPTEPSKETIDRVTSPLTQALSLFQIVKNDRQIAACHFHLGSVYQQVWQVKDDQEEGSRRLELALNHYKNAHQYYSKFDIGPTLIIILLDMCDLYLCSYSTSEAQLKTLFMAKKAFFSTVCASQGENSSAIEGQPEPPWAPSSASDLVVSLLGGAFYSLLDCRFALTPAVVEQHHLRMAKLIHRVCQRMSQVLMHVFKAQSREQLPPPVQENTSESDNGRVGIANTDSGNDYASLKSMYAELVRCLTQWQSIDGTSANVGSETGIMSQMSPPTSGNIVIQDTATSVRDSALLLNAHLETLNRNKYLASAFAASSNIGSSELKDIAN